MWLIFPNYYSSFKRAFFNTYYSCLNEKVKFIAISKHIKKICK